MEKPNLIEPGMKYFIKSSLKNCNDYRNNYKNYIINIKYVLLREMSKHVLFAFVNK